MSAYDMPGIEPMPTVLIVERDMGFADALAAEFSRAGFEVQVAEDGATALRDLGNEIPDLLVMDSDVVVIGPPQPLLEVLRRQPVMRAVPIIALEPRDEAQTHDPIRSGADDCLLKPLPAEEVVARGLSVLERMTAWQSAQQGVRPS